MTDRAWGMVACHVAAIGIAAGATPAQAQSLSDLASRLESLQQELQAQRSLIEAQSEKIAEQRQEIHRLREQVVAASSLSDERAAGLPGAGMQEALQASVAAAQAAPLPDKPVGEAPELPRVEQQVQAVPEGAGVLTRPGHFTFEPSVEYTNSSSNRLVFRGVEIVTGIPLGVIEASPTQRNTVAATAAVTFGLMKNMEVQVRVPYLLRSDRYDFVQLRDNQIVRSLGYKARNIGDAEFILRYQINRPIGQHPIFIGSVRVKSTTGSNPYTIPFDEFGIPLGLATGSGFWAVQPGLNFLLPSDPVVIFGGVSYLYHMPKNINREVGKDIILGRVDPGDAINANLGFGFSLNPKFSFSLGYRHTYVRATTTEINKTIQRSRPFHVGALNFGMSYRLNKHQSLNFDVGVGVTEDAPDVSISLRMPFNF